MSRSLATLRLPIMAFAAICAMSFVSMRAGGVIRGTESCGILTFLTFLLASGAAASVYALLESQR